MIKISANPHELKDLVDFSNNLKLMLGDMKKVPKKDEIKNILNLRRSAYFKKDLKIGSQFSPNDINWLRPIKKLSINNLNNIKNKKLKKGVKKGDLVTNKLFK